MDSLDPASGSSFLFSPFLVLLLSLSLRIFGCGLYFCGWGGGVIALALKLPAIALFSVSE
jgi:hypothetical protein